MGPHPRRFAIVAAVLWLGSGLGGQAEAGIILQAPAGLDPGDQFRFVFVTDGSRNATSANIASRLRPKENCCSHVRNCRTAPASGNACTTSLAVHHCSATARAAFMSSGWVNRRGSVTT
jgi:hypothetical protein